MDIVPNQLSLSLSLSGGEGRAHRGWCRASKEGLGSLRPGEPECVKNDPGHGDLSLRP